MVGLFHYIVVDASSRLDSATRLVCNLSEKIMLIAHADVASLWSAGRVAQYLGESGSRDRFALVLNRYRKVAASMKRRPRPPSEPPCSGGFPISTSRSRPRLIAAFLDAAGNHGHCPLHYRLAEYLTRDDLEVKRTAWSLFKTV